MSDPILRAARLAARHFETIRDQPVSGPARAADLRQHLESAYRFDGPTDADAVLDDVAAMLSRGSVHVTHPAYFGLFNPSVLPAAIGAATLTAAYNPQTAAWTHCPAAIEMEQHALRFLAGRIGYDPATVAAHFCSGGQEANTTAVIVALTHAFPAIRDRGLRALPGDPVLYVSAEAHHSFEKAAHLCGLGRAAVRRIAVDAALRIDVAALARAVAEDRAAGRLPFLAVGTAGATSSGVIDPLPAVADLCVAERMWFHCDAAWGGGALLSASLRGHLAGIERSDSVTWDAHKWLQVPLGSGMFFTRHPEAPLAAFATDSAYMPAARPSDGTARHDPFNVSHQWSRRAPGIALFAALAELGAPGYERLVDHMAAMGDLMKRKLGAAGWRVVNETPLPLACFTHPRIESGAVSTGDVARTVHRRGRAWVSPTVLAARADGPQPSGSPRPAEILRRDIADGARVLRACITSYRTDERDLDVLVAELRAAVGE